MPTPRSKLRPLLALLLLLTGAPLVSRVQAQEATAPPPAPGEPGAADPLELLPAIGRIGAEVGLHGGWSRNPYSLGSGVQGAGFINLPLKKLGSGVLSYQIALRFARSTSDPVTVTNPVAFVANLAATGRGDIGPFPYTRAVRSVGSIFVVEPFGFKYAIHSFGRFRPYLGRASAWESSSPRKCRRRTRAWRSPAPHPSTQT